MMMNIIGITGPAASGKGTVVDYLVKEQGYQHYSVSDYLSQQLEQSGQEINRDTMRELANQLRSEHGSSYLIEQLFLQAQAKGENAIIESIRTTGEVAKLKEKPDFLLLSVDADQELRYERAIQRGSAKDDISWEKFVEQELLESSSQDPNFQNIQACKALADIHIFNNEDLNSLYHQLDTLFKI